MDIICVCGSVRFKDEMLKFRDEQNAKGNWVLLPENMEIDIQKIDTRVKERMDSLHKYKIDHADSVLIWNKGGYIGESTRQEMFYALEQEKPIKYLEGIEKIPMLAFDRRVNAGRLASELDLAFNWYDTKDGYTFWKDVRGRLVRLSKEGF